MIVVSLDKVVSSASCCDDELSVFAFFLSQSTPPTVRVPNHPNLLLVVFGLNVLSFFCVIVFAE